LDEGPVAGQGQTLLSRLFYIVCYSGLLFVLSGCLFKDEPMPTITRDYSADIPRATVSVSKPDLGGAAGAVPSAWYPPSWAEKKWTAIIIHHSGTQSGNAAIFDRWHREGNHWEGVGYDFVIGNGTDSSDGQVEVTFRWRQQKVGAHTGGTANNWANRDGIGICLVGNFDQTRPTPRQMESLVKLVKFLQRRYGISSDRIFGHGQTPGARRTDCPGRNFPMAQLKSQLSM